MTDDNSDPDLVRRRVLAGGTAVTFTAGVAAAVARSRGSGTPTTERAATSTTGSTAPPDTTATTAPADTTTAPSTEAPPTTAAPTTTTAPTPGVAHRVLTPEERRLHVAQRFTYGPTHEVVAQLENGGIDAFVAEQLDPAAISDQDCEARLASLGTLGESARQIQNRESGQ